MEVIDHLDIETKGIGNTKYDAIIFEVNSEANSITQFVSLLENFHSLPLVLIIDPQQKDMIENLVEAPLCNYLIRPISDIDFNRVIQNIINYRALFEENKILSDRLKVFERQLDTMFTKLEEKIQTNIQTLNRKEEIWQNFFDSLSFGILFVNKDYYIIKANTSITKFLNIPANKLIGRLYHEVIYFQKALEQCPGYLAMKSGKIETTEKQILKINENLKCIRQTATPTFNHHNDITGFIEYYHDVSLKKTEQQKI